MNTLYHGYAVDTFLFEDHEALVVIPETPNGRLAIKTEYFDAFPEAIELPLLAAGFHLCYIKNDHRWGGEDDLARKARFVRHVAQQYGLNPACVPVGMSCGGLIGIKFAARFPELVGCLYLDAPVVNYMSCPCGFGVGEPLDKDNSEILNALGLPGMPELMAYRDMPLDNLPKLIAARIPLALVAGDSDRVVPYCENGVFVERVYREAGIPMTVHIKPGCDHHPHGLPDPAPVLAFILENLQ